MQPHHLSILRKLSIVSVAAWIIFSIYNAQIVPLAQRAKSLEQSVGEFHGKTSITRKSIGKLADLQRQAARIETERAGAQGDLPKGPLMVWLPQLLQKHFNSFGVSVGVTRLITIREEPDLPGYRRAFWAISLPGLTGEKAAEGFLRALSELEQKSRFIKVTDAWFKPDLDNPGQYIAAVSLSALALE